MLIGLAGAAPAVAAPVSEAEMARAMQGCWNRIVDAGNSSQMCLKGGLEGAVTTYDCQSHDDLTECASNDGRYAFRNQKFWNTIDDVAVQCDVYLEPRKRVTLSNCIAPGNAPIAEIIYERAVGQ